MARTLWISRDRGAAHRRFCLQGAFVRRHFPCFHCRFYRRQWHCRGTIMPSEDCDAYEIKITYRFGSVPHVSVLRPQITPRAAIHMYSDGSLCLYFPEDTPWKPSDDLHQKTIPWTSEWLVFYELFKIRKKWLGPESPHTIRRGETNQVRAQVESENT